jgi:hypothetical protein
MADVYGMPVEELLVEQPDGGLAVPFTLTADRRVFGHAARWGQCHVGYGDMCITAPASQTDYSFFHHGAVQCADGTSVATGPLTMGCDHAAAHLMTTPARDHYANSGLAFADVRATNGALGVWVSGVVRPGVTDDQLAALQGSSLSGDWRRERVKGSDVHEFIAALAVNVPGYPIAREAADALVELPSVAASAGMVDGIQQSLVAAGIVTRCPNCGGQQSLDVPEVMRILTALDLRTRHLNDATVDSIMASIRPDPAQLLARIRS